MSVVLRPTEEADLDFVVALEAGPDAAPFVEAWPAERHRAAFLDPDISHLMVVADAERAGFVIIAGLRDPNDCVELRRIVIDRPGRGLGRAALTLVLDHAFGELEAHRVWLDVKPDNPRARHLYASLGFVEEGVLRDALRTAEGYESLILMAKLTPSPRSPDPEARGRGSESAARRRDRGADRRDDQVDAGFSVADRAPSVPFSGRSGFEGCG